MSQHDKAFRSLFTALGMTSLVALVVGLPAPAQASGGPDAYGYTWASSLDVGGPTFEWVDITDVGIEVLDLGDDNSSIPIAMNMSFPYYWSTYDTVIVGVNGWLGFEPGTLAWCFPTLPTAAGIDNFLAPFLADLDLSGDANPGRVYSYYDETNSRFIVSWLDVPFATDSGGSDGANTFQAILYANGDIIFQYLDADVLAWTNHETCAADFEIGIENITGNIGLEAYNEALPPDSLALRFDPPEVVLLNLVDLTPAWHQNDRSAGVFVVLDDSFTPEVRLANVGNLDHENVYSLSLVIRNAANEVVYNESSSGSPIAAGGVDELSGEPVLLQPGRHELRSTITSAQDINPSNNSTNSLITVVDLSAPTALLTYVPVTAADTALAYPGGVALAIQIEPPVYPLEITGIAAIVVPSEDATQGFTLQLLDDDAPGGLPGSILFEQLVTIDEVIADAPVVVMLDAPVEVTDGTVYVAFEATHDEVGLAANQVTLGSRRTFESSPGWTEYRGHENTEFQLGALVTYDDPDVGGDEDADEPADAGGDVGPDVGDGGSDASDAEGDGADIGGDTGGDVVSDSGSDVTDETSTSDGGDDPDGDQIDVATDATEDGPVNDTSDEDAAEDTASDSTADDGGASDDTSGTVDTGSDGAAESRTPGTTEDDGCGCASVGPDSIASNALLAGLGLVMALIPLRRRPQGADTSGKRQ